MGKFRIRVKLQGFELEVDGDREDIPAITNAVQRQLGGMMQTADFAAAQPEPRPEPLTIESTEVKGKKSSRKRSSTDRSSADSNLPRVIEFRHESSTYGSPKQNWTVAQKCIWLLFVLDGIKGLKEVTAPQLTATWNSQFKAAGKLHPPNVPRELSTAKVSSPAPVGEDKASWFLTDEGKAVAQTLVKEGLGQP
jgi:hypothetical protein